MQKQRPSVGRIVHVVVSPDTEHIPAIIVSVVDDTTVNLQVFANNEFVPVVFMRSAVLDESARLSGSWHWCEYVPAIEVKDAKQD